MRWTGALEVILGAFPEIVMLLLLTLLACGKDPEPEPAPIVYPPVVPGAPHVGAAEGYLRLPVGTPLSGFTVRCGCLTGQSRQDERTSNYATAFVPSTGIQTWPTIKVIWIDNGDDHLVLTKTDSIYSFDGLVVELERRLADATGERLKHKVVHATNHSHSSFGTFSDQKTFYLGSDKYNEENFQRFVDQMVEVALQAYDNRQPAKLGLGWAQDWDPDNTVYRDRRGINNDLVVWPDQRPDAGGKDPFLGVMRFDTLNDEPIAMMVNFGMHGIIGSEQSPLVSTDSGGHLEYALQEQFDEPVVVMYTQGAGGDASPAGRQDGDFARMESIGDLGAPLVRALYDAVPTGSDEIRMETASRAIPKHPDEIRVTRDGTVDWRYLPYDEDRKADGVIYDDDGSIASPLDEFNTEFGAVFCGTGDLDFPIGKLDTNAYPYSNCMEVDLLSRLILVFFKVDEADMPLPLPESLKALTTVSRLGPLKTLKPDGSVIDEELLMGFFPGEATAMYTEQWRRRAQAELGYDMPMMVSYAQDHEGYLLIPEDWLLGEYEADISVWGPLEGEHILEGVLQTVDEVLHTDVHTDPNASGRYAPTTYPDVPLPTRKPDPTPTAGTRLLEPPAYYWMPMDLQPELDTPEQLPRVQGLAQIGWIGGDPGVDLPNVELQRLEGDTWRTVRTHAGRPIDEGLPDILVGYTPDPVRPLDTNGNGVIDPAEELQTHYWWAGWQTVGHVRDRAGLPLGTYRLHVTGTRYVGDDETWPWTGESYTVEGPAFELVPAALHVEPTDGGVLASLPAPANGFRMIHLDGQDRGHNPLVGPVTLTLTTEEGVEEIEADPTLSGHRSLVPVDLTGVIELTITDGYGNTGSLTL